MSKHDDEVRLRHMLEHAREAVAFVVGKDRSDLEASRILSLALVRLIEIVGEAANRVSKQGKNSFRKFPGHSSSV